MANIVLPPTPPILQVADFIDRTLSQFLHARQTVPALGKFESEVEAMKLITLVVRNIEAITELAKIDLVLAPPANVLARAVFEIAVKAAWMVTPNDPFEREIRWLAYLEEEERMHERVAGRAARFAGDPTFFENQRDVLRTFRAGVERSLPSSYSRLPGNPSVEQMLEGIGQKRIYGVYTLLCALCSRQPRVDVALSTQLGYYQAGR
jgi:hypothetical protein